MFDNCSFQITYRISTRLDWPTVYALTRGLFCCLLHELRSAQIVLYESSYIVFLFTQHHESMNVYENDNPHKSTSCLTRAVCFLLMTSQSFADNTRNTLRDTTIETRASEKRRKSDANREDFENWLYLTSTPITIRILTRVFRTSGPNLVVLAWACDELLWGQAQNGVNCDFEVKFDLEGQGQSPPKQ